MAQQRAGGGDDTLRVWIWRRLRRASPPAEHPAEAQGLPPAQTLPLDTPVTVALRVRDTVTADTLRRHLDAAGPAAQAPELPG